jgi:hypothetical protein
MKHPHARGVAALAGTGPPRLTANRRPEPKTLAPARRHSPTDHADLRPRPVPAR